jgi:hypothetical protein
MWPTLASSGMRRNTPLLSAGRVRAHPGDGQSDASAQDHRAGRFRLGGERPGRRGSWPPGSVPGPRSTTWGETARGPPAPARGWKRRRRTLRCPPGQGAVMADSAANPLRPEARPGTRLEARAETRLAVSCAAEPPRTLASRAAIRSTAGTAFAGDSGRSPPSAFACRHQPSGPTAGCAVCVARRPPRMGRASRRTPARRAPAPHPEALARAGSTTDGSALSSRRPPAARMAEPSPPSSSTP